MNAASLLAPLANHLWQSTFFAMTAGLLTLMLKRNRAELRYWLWVATSVKFVIPFSLLISFGSYLGSAIAAAKPPVGLSSAMAQINEPFAVAQSASSHPMVGTDLTGPTVDLLTLCVLTLWCGGTIAIALRWYLGWRRIAVLARHAEQLTEGREVEALRRLQRNLTNSNVIRSVLTVNAIEPGLFGIFRPSLLLPAGIGSRLDNAQLEAIIAHELSHARRHDNLWAAIHMAAEALFWFHPLVWWIGRRLVHERECVCDEDVLRQGHEPGAYAQGMLCVCELYAAASLACVAGISGSDLKNRVVDIMTKKQPIHISFARKVLLGTAGFALLSVPILFGSMQVSQRLAFEVVSVRLNKSGDPRDMRLQYLPGGRLSVKGVPLPLLLAEAYDIPLTPERFLISPSFDVKPLESERYDIEAVAPQGAVPSGASVEVRNGKLKLMLQTLLEDRFKVIVRRETKELPLYAIVVGKNGPKLQKAAIAEKDCPDPAINPTDPVLCHAMNGGQGQGLHGQAINMSDLAAALSRFSDRPVVDKTGLIGLYNIQTAGWVPLRPRPARTTDPTPSQAAEDAAFADPSRPTAFDVFEKLGLKLESQKGSVETLTLVHAESPSEN